MEQSLEKWGNIYTLLSSCASWFQYTNNMWQVLKEGWKTRMQMTIWLKM